MKGYNNSGVGYNITYSTVVEGISCLYKTTAALYFAENCSSDHCRLSVLFANQPLMTIRTIKMAFLLILYEMHLAMIANVLCSTVSRMCLKIKGGQFRALTIKKIWGSKFITTFYFL